MDLGSTCSLHDREPFLATSEPIIKKSAKILQEEEHVRAIFDMNSGYHAVLVKLVAEFHGTSMKHNVAEKSAV